MNTYTFKAANKLYTVKADGYDPMDELGNAMAKANRNFLDTLQCKGYSVYPGSWHEGDDKYSYVWELGDDGNPDKWYNKYSYVLESLCVGMWS